MKLATTLRVLLFVSLGGVSSTLLAQSHSGPSSSEFESALVSVNALRVDYNEQFSDYGQLPQSINDLGYSESDFQTNLVDHVGISSSSGAILIGFSDRFGDKQWAALIPKISNYYINGWVCQTTIAAPAGNSTGCQFGVSYAQVDKVLGTGEFSSAIGALASLRLQHVDWYYSRGEFPTTMSQLGVDQYMLDLLHTRNISHLMVDPKSNALVASLDDEVFGSNHWLWFTPILGSYGNVSSWSCETTLPQNLVAVNGCSAGLGVEEILSVN